MIVWLYYKIYTLIHIYTTHIYVYVYTRVSVSLFILKRIKTFHDLSKYYSDGYDGDAGDDDDGDNNDIADDVDVDVYTNTRIIIRTRTLSIVMMSGNALEL